MKKQNDDILELTQLINLLSNKQFDFNQNDDFLNVIKKNIYLIILKNLVSIQKTISYNSKIISVDENGKSLEVVTNLNKDTVIVTKLLTEITEKVTNFDSLDYLLLLAQKAGLSVVDLEGKIIGKKDESESANSQSVHYLE
ncbi:hypothetical protein MICAER10613_036980 [Microcystis aeruginosa]